MVDLHTYSLRDFEDFCTLHPLFHHQSRHNIYLTATLTLLIIYFGLCVYTNTLFLFN